SGIGCMLLMLFLLVRQPHLFDRLFERDKDNAKNLAEVQRAVWTAPVLDRDDWPQWRGVYRDGIGKVPGMSLDWNAKPPKIIWQTPCGKGYSSLAITTGRVFTQDWKDGQERVLCLDAATGEERWTYPWPTSYSILRSHHNGPRATPTFSDGKLYVVGTLGRFLCLEIPEQGSPKMLWEHELAKDFDATIPAWGYACSPLIEGRNVIVQPGGKEASVAAFDCETGKVCWRTMEEPTGYSSPMAATFGGQRQIVAFLDDRLVGLRADDGEKLWSFDWYTDHQANTATPIIAGDTIFISSNYGSGCALVRVLHGEKDEWEAEEVYIRRNKLMRCHHSTCVLHDGHLYGFDTGRGDLKCIDMKTGTEKWFTSEVRRGTLVLAEGHLIALSEDGTLSLVEATPTEFRLRGEMKRVLSGSDCYALPAIAGGRLFVRDHDRVVCLSLSGE
ncbi:MAG TPA: PQQ-binding-like beta-propeller repeat protein, partial [Gemmataceae bacterium]|nr:PQQ-binding-like beta-propeller repeat protein [Gemmataceae bacterium]